MSRLPIRSSAILLLLSLTMLLSGCQSTVAISPCAWVKIISVSKADVLTDQTAREILAHNEKVEKICSP